MSYSSKTAIFNIEYLLLVLTFAFSSHVSAGALGSIYNGAQYKLDGQMLVQDAEDKNSFYYLPQNYNVNYTSGFNANGELKNSYDVQNLVVGVGADKVSVYTINLLLDEPGKMQLALATQALRRTFGSNAKIKGLAPVCGMALDFFGKSTSPTENPPNAKIIRYSMSSTDAGKCDSVLDPSELSVELRIPLKEEPTWAKSMTSDVGEFLPSIRLILPYKYTDTVTLKIDAKQVYDSLKEGVGLEGSYSVISAGARANISKSFNNLNITGSVHLDCQTPNGCDKYRESALKILEDVFLKYTALNTKDGDTSPLIVADKDHASTGTKFRLDFAMDQQTAEHMGSYTINFNDTQYSSIQTQAQIRISNVPKDVIDPEVRKLMEP